MAETPSQSTPAAPAKDFFISYTKKDVAWASWIAGALEAAGYTVEYQKRDFTAGEDFVGEMDRALSGCERLIAVLSPAYLKSAFASAEWQSVFARDPDGSRRALVPVRVRKVKPKGLLAARIAIDLVGIRGEKEARKRLLDGVREQLEPSREPQQPAQPAPFPPARSLWARAADGLRQLPLEFWLGSALAVLLALFGVEECRERVIPDSGYSETRATLLPGDKQDSEKEKLRIRYTNDGNRPSIVMSARLRLTECNVDMQLDAQNEDQLRVPPKGKLEVDYTGGVARHKAPCDDNRRVAGADWKLELDVKEHGSETSTTLSLDPGQEEFSLRFVLWRFGWPIPEED